MSKKILFASLIAMMLVFGFATTAFAYTAPNGSWVAAGAAPNLPADMPYYSGPFALAAFVDGPPVDCFNFGLGAYVAFTVENPAGTANDPRFVHISTNHFYADAAQQNDDVVFGFYDDAGINLGCGAGDAIFPVTPGETYFVVVGTPIFSADPGTHFELVIAPARNDGHIIVAGNTTAPSTPAEFATMAAQASTEAGGVPAHYDPVAGAWAGVWGAPDVNDGITTGVDAINPPGAPALNAPYAAGDERFAFLDVPAGTYNVAIYDQGATIPWGAVVQNVTGPASVVWDETDSDEQVTVEAETFDGDGAVDGLNGLNIYYHPDGGQVFNDIPVGTTAGGGALVYGQADFRVPADGHIDVVGYMDANPFDYFLIAMDVNPVLGDVEFHLEADPPANVLACYPENGGPAYNSLEVRIDPPGVLQARDVNVEFGNHAGCDDNTITQDSALSDFEGDEIFLTPDMDYDVTNGFLVGATDGWAYVFNPTTPIWNFAADAWGGAAVDYNLEYVNVFGMGPFQSAVTADATSVKAPATINYTLDEWTDLWGNPLVEVTSAADDQELDCVTGLAIADADALPDDIAPCFAEVYGVPQIMTQYSNDWATATSASTADIGRRVAMTWLQTGGEIPEYRLLPAGYDYVDDCGNAGGSCPTAYWSVPAAIEPVDVGFGTDWGYHFILTMYEWGMTAGVSATEYDPYGDVTRGQMATYIAAVFTNPLVGTGANSAALGPFGFGPRNATELVPAGYPAYAGGFTDVLATDWFAEPVQFMLDNGITAGMGGGLYGSTLPVIRADMSIFMERAGRHADSIVGGWTNWPTGLGTPIFYPLGLTGSLFPNNPGIYDGWFADVAGTEYYAHWTEEAFADGLALPCSPGVITQDLNYCPGDVVDRSMMASFMVNTFVRVNPLPLVVPIGPLPPNFLVELAPLWWVGPVPVPEYH